MKSAYKKELLKEIDNLSSAEIKTIIKVLHVVKEEMRIKKRVDKQEILKYAGMLKGLGSEKEKVFYDVISRRSLFMGRNLNL